jgi:hypothetical protein
VVVFRSPGIACVTNCARRAWRTQGPCKACQLVAVNAKILDTSVRILAWDGPDLEVGRLEWDDDDVADARTSALALMLAAIEGPAVRSVHDQMLAAIGDMGMLRSHLVRSYRTGAEAYAPAARGSQLIQRGAAISHLVRAQARRLSRGSIVLESELPSLDVMAIPADGWNRHLLEGFNLYILMEMLAEADKTGAVLAHVAGGAYSETDAVAYWFFRRNTRRVCARIVCRRVFGRVVACVCFARALLRGILQFALSCDILCPPPLLDVTF